MWGPAEILVMFTLGSVPGEYLSTLQTNSTRWFPCPCMFLVSPSSFQVHPREQGEG